MVERQLDLGWVRVFDAAARLGSLTAAAQSLGLSQPAVSYAIQSLEERIGHPLLKRGHRGSALTPAGRILFRAVHDAVEGIDGAVREIRNLGRRPVVRLFTDYGFASFWMMPRVARFRTIRPDVEVHIVASAATDADAAEVMDVAVLFGARTDFPPGAVQLVPERIRPVCSPSFARAHGLPGNLLAFARLPLLHLESTPRPRWFSWADWFAALRIARQSGPGDLGLNTYGLVVQAAIADQGLALGWDGLIDAALADGTLVAVGPALERPDSGYWMIPGADLSEPAAALVDWILEEIRQSGA